jgi:phage head maturation protease
MTSKKPHAAELDRMNSKLERLAAQSKALRKAINQFGENFDAKTWREAFDSVDADEVRTQVRLLLNHLPRFIKSYLTWLAKHGIQV